MTRTGSVYAFIIFSFIIAVGCLFFLCGDVMLCVFNTTGSEVWGLNQTEVYKYMKTFGIIIALIGIIGLVTRPFAMGKGK